MSFETPIFLGGLLLIGPLIALYFIKSKPVRVVVPSNALWEEVVRRTKANSLFQRYRNSILLILQILVLALLALGLARPFRQVAFAGRSVILLDVSASMTSTDVPGSRFEAARQFAQSIVKKHASEGDIALITLDSSCRIDVPFESTEGLVSRTLGDLRPTDRPGPDVAETLTLLAGILDESVKRVYILTDQLPPEALIDRIQGPQVVLKYFGESKDNLALSNVEVRTGEDQTLLTGTVTNYGGFTRNAKIYLSRDGIRRTRIDLKVAGKDSRPFRKEIDPLEPGLYEVRVESDADHLAADSVHHLVAGRSELTAIVVAADPTPLMRVLSALDGLRVRGLTPDKVASGLPEADVYVLEKVAVEGLEGKPVLSICPPHPAATPTPDPTVGEVLWTHPLMKYLTFEAARFEALVPLEEMKDDEVVARLGDGRPLVLMRGSGTVKSVICAFDPARTNFGRMVGFPILVVNAMRSLVGRSLGGGKSHQVDETWSLPPGLAGTIRLETPTGERHEVDVSSPPRIPGRYFSHIGTYTAHTPDGATLTIPVNLQDFGESTIEPSGTGEVTSGGGAQAQTPVPRGVWEPFLILATLLVLGEWFAYCRWGAA